MAAGFTGSVSLGPALLQGSADLSSAAGLEISPADLESIMIHIEKE